MAAEVANISIAQHEPLQIWPSEPFQCQRSLLGFLAGWPTWQYVVIFILTVVLYDQGESSHHNY
jgi:C-22 sterol desaturase